MNEKEQKKEQNTVQSTESTQKEGEKKQVTDLEKVTLERDEYLAGWQRAKADFANAKKRWEESIAEYRKLANEGLIEELLPVLQSFEMAFGNKEAWEKADKNWRSGVEYIYNQLKNVLSQNGLQEIDPTGMKFDPNLHDAVQHEVVEESSKAGMILKVMEKGYELGGKLIKPAKVIVAEQKSE